MRIIHRKATGNFEKKEWRNLILRIKKKSRNFWRPIYENDKSHNDNAQWINDHIKYIDTLNLDEQQLPIWESKDVNEAIKKMSDWKGAGVDNLQIYWWKHFSFTHNRLSTYFSEILHNPETSPELMNLCHQLLCLAVTPLRLLHREQAQQERE